MAKRLGRSLRFTSPDLNLSVVTDGRQHFAKGDYDQIIDVQPHLGPDMRHKLNLDSYSPYERTLYIDSDCLATRPIEFMWPLFEGQDFGVCGRMRGDHLWYGMRIADIRAQFGIAGPLPVFNGGLMYFNRSEVSQAIFREARQQFDRYSQIGLSSSPGRHWAAADEPVLAIAMALNGVGVVEDHGSTMRTPINKTGPIEIDIPAFKCSFVKEGQLVKPAIIHFANTSLYDFIYLRETLKIYHPAFGKLLHAITDAPYRLGYWLVNPLMMAARSVLRRS
ncbi:hypothetical protein [uncultured Devosia sp.]|uniref:hypothetical protein n=1 Tax=uncultured Devosia sp. TaxID=211434 RepID=UPI0035CA423A